MLKPGDNLEQLAIEGRYAGQEEPQADSIYERQAGELGSQRAFPPQSGLIKTLLLGARYRFPKTASIPERRAKTRMNTKRSCVR